MARTEEMKGIRKSFSKVMGSLLDSNKRDLVIYADETTYVSDFLGYTVLLSFHRLILHYYMFTFLFVLSFNTWLMKTHSWAMADEPLFHPRNG